MYSLKNIVYALNREIISFVSLSHLIVRLHQDLIVLAKRHQKHDGGDVLKAVDPLPPL